MSSDTPVFQTGNAVTDPLEAERTRLRRNQRNSRARKQAYVQDLERRWQECVELGAQATTRMQQEARKVQEENRLLRVVLREQGFNDITLQHAIEKARLSEGLNVQTQRGARTACEAAAMSGACPPSSNCRSAVRTDVSIPSAQSSLPMPPIVNPTSLVDQGNLSQTMDLYNWLDDLCQIKDALGVEAGYNLVDDLGAQNFTNFNTIPLQPLETFGIDQQIGVTELPSQVWPTNESYLLNDMTDTLWAIPPENQNA
ncbi:hypothetical protein B0J14DRAFT_569393 [Halenospora varia]|nr:hypothetical protein B0J14DRAFT_569393 [Halenospora varia]